MRHFSKEKKKEIWRNDTRKRVSTCEYLPGERVASVLIVTCGPQTQEIPGISANWQQVSGVVFSLPRERISGCPRLVGFGAGLMTDLSAQCVESSPTMHRSYHSPFGKDRGCACRVCSGRFGGTSRLSAETCQACVVRGLRNHLLAVRSRQTCVRYEHPP